MYLTKRVRENDNERLRISNSETTVSFFHCFYLKKKNHLTLLLTLSRPLFSSSYLLGPEKGQRKKERAIDTHTHTHPGLSDRNRYKSPPPYPGQHTDKCVSTPHPTDPSLKTSDTHVRRCGCVCVCVTGRLMTQFTPTYYK